MDANLKFWSWWSVSLQGTKIRLAPLAGVVEDKGRWHTHYYLTSLIWTTFNWCDQSPERLRLDYGCTGAMSVSFGNQKFESLLDQAVDFVHDLFTWQVHLTSSPHSIGFNWSPALVRQFKRKLVHRNTPTRFIKTCLYACIFTIVFVFILSFKAHKWILPPLKLRRFSSSLGIIPASLSPATL